METEIKLSSTKERLDKYILETEEWKKQTTENFHEQLANKEKEIKDLRETVDLLMKKGEKVHEEEIMNQLLDFISNENRPKSSPLTAQTEPQSQSQSQPQIQSQPQSQSQPQTQESSMKQSSSPHMSPISKLMRNSEKLKESDSSKRKTSTPHLFKVQEFFFSFPQRINFNLGYFTWRRRVCERYV